MNARCLTALSLLFSVGCQTDEPAPAAAELEWATDASELMRVKGSLGAVNGQHDFCDGATPCLVGEGDCDLDTQCDAGLVCVDDIGDNFGLAWTTDVCAPSHCENGILDGDETAADFGGSCGNICGGTPGALGYCRPGCECPEGVGDCNTDADCQAGLTCGQNNGAQFGLHWTYDVCVDALCSNGVLDPGEIAIDFGGTCGDTCSGQNGDQEGFCTEGCPCDHGEGDCDADSECAEGTHCILNMGGVFGLDPLHDVCMAPYAVNDLVEGNLVITEIMINPLAMLDASAEYFELYNNTNNYINLNGLHVRDNPGLGSFTVTVDLIVAPKAYVSFGRTANTALNGGFIPDYDYINTFALNDTQDQIILYAGAGGTELDRVAYTTVWYKPNGRSLELSRNRINSNNNVASVWCESITLLPGGDYGTPGKPNRYCP